MNQPLHSQGARTTGERSVESDSSSLESSKKPLDRRWPLVLFFMPLAILLFDHQWIFSDPVRDPWIYYGYFRNAPGYLVTFRHLYYTSRLSVILPGYWIHGILAPIPANIVLHLGMYWAAVFSFYGIARALFGARVALLAAVCLGAHPFFLFAVGQNYVDGFGITYFLLALLGLTASRQARLWKTALVFAGACTTALISANLFYAIYLPFLVVWFLAIERWPSLRALASSAAFYCAGGVAALAAFGFVSKAAGGSFLYLIPSGRFVRGFVQHANPFKDPMRQWLSGAVWLAVPFVILIGCLIVLFRMPRRDADCEIQRIRFSQLIFIAFAVLMLALQLSPYAAVLQYSYYASLMIPLAWLALAGQLAFLLRSPARFQFSWLAGLTVVSAVLTASLSVLEPKRLPLSALPLLLAVLVGLGALITIWRGAAGARSVAFLLLFVFLSGSVAKQFPQIGRSLDQFRQDRAELFREIDQSVTAIRQVDRFGNVFFWWNGKEDLAQIYDCIAATSLSGKRIINLAFPETLRGNLSDGGRMASRMKIAILSRKSRFAEAEDALGQIGLRPRLLSTKKIAVGRGDFTIMFLELARAPRPRN